MSKEVQTIQPQAMTFTDEQVELIKRTVARGATNDELALFFHQAKKAGLDPLAREIYFIKYGNQMSIITGIDGYYKVAQRNDTWLGNKTEFLRDEDGNIISATCTVKKLVKGEHIGEFSATCLMHEYNKKVSQWKSIPARMLEKCAESAALRKAFPNELSGTYTADEMQHTSVEPVVEEPKKAVGGTIFSANDSDHVSKMKIWCLKQEILDPKHVNEIIKRMDGRPLTDTRAIVIEFENELKTYASEP